MERKVKSDRDRDTNLALAGRTDGFTIKLYEE
jgi:hypothetical protein